VSNEDLYALRQRIESVDEGMLRLLEERVKLAKEIGKVKAEIASTIP